MKKFIAIILALVMALSLCAVASAEGNLVKVSLRIEGIEECLYYNASLEVTYETDELNVLQVMQFYAETEDALEIVYDDAGTYITAIGGEESGTGADWAGWMYLVNGVAPVVGMSDQNVADGDVIVFYYSDQFGIGFDFPVVNIIDYYSGDSGLVKLTGERTVYLEDGTVETQTVALGGVTLEWNGENYVTDENGQAFVPLAAGWAAIQVSRVDETTGLPTVMRFEDGYKVYIPFEDTAADEWYNDAVKFATAEGMFKGVTATTFSPNTNMSRDQIFVMLSRIAGESLVTTGAEWYVEAYEWAIENGIAVTNADDTYLTAFPTRGELFNMLYKTIALAGDTDMTQRADITGAVDYDDIPEAYQDAAAWAVAADLIHGTSEDELTISPNDQFTRAQACQILMNYFA